MDDKTENKKVCPICGANAIIKVYGPFFTPSKEHRVARACPKYCWRGTMRDTFQELEAIGE